MFVSTITFSAQSENRENRWDLLRSLYTLQTGINGGEVASHILGSCLEWVPCYTWKPHVCSFFLYFIEMNKTLRMFYPFACAVIQIPGHLKFFTKITLLIQLTNNNPGSSVLQLQAFLSIFQDNSPLWPSQRCGTANTAESQRVDGLTVLGSLQMQSFFCASQTSSSVRAMAQLTPAAVYLG